MSILLTEKEYNLQKKMISTVTKCFLLMTDEIIHKQINSSGNGSNLKFNGKQIGVQHAGRRYELRIEF